MSSCGERQVMVTRDMKRTVDTLYKNQRDSLIPILDSTCKVTKINDYQRLLDSVVDLRIAERERILKKKAK
jgi:hypothetical protein